MCNVSIWRSGLLITARRAVNKGTTADTSVNGVKRFGIFAPFPRQNIDHRDTRDVYCPLPSHLNLPPLRASRGSDVLQWTSVHKAAVKPKPFIPHSSSSQKSLNAADNCIEELSSQCLQPSTEGQLSQT